MRPSRSVQPAAAFGARVPAAALTLTLTLLVGVVLGPPGCEAAPDTVVGSDVPQIVGLESRHASEVVRVDDVLVGGRFLYRGAMRDPEQVAADTEQRFRDYGWALARKSVTPTTAVLVFEKEGRQAEVDLKVNLLNPAMGAGALTVHRAGSAQAGRSAPPAAGGTSNEAPHSGQRP